jgi:tryptophan halogenase
MIIDSILIVGGGSSGWMTAATLIKEFPNKKITLIESPNIPIIGVGESTIQGIRRWTTFLDIDEKDFLKHTDGSYKLSIKFTDFYKKGETFHYPFGEPHLVGTKAGLNDWWFKKFLNPETPNSDYVDCYYPQMGWINNNKISYNENNEIYFNFKKYSAFHFDAVKFGIWLKDNYCIPRGVKHIKEDVISIEQNEEGIKSLNNKHKADLYIDCTGFKSLLLGQTLNEPFNSYKDLLPNNSAWATRMPYKNKNKELVSYTNCTAINNGWIWNIPLWSRIGTGYVYSDKFVNDEDALKEFKKYLGTDELEFKNIKMRVGLHNRLWVKNVVAIGLSAGFIEPLESNGLFTVHEFLMILLRNMQREKVSQWDRDNFSYECKTLFRNFAEFVALHYALSQRTDTEYWKSHFNKTWEENLINIKPKHTNGMFQAVLDRTHKYSFDVNGGLHCIAAGMNWAPTNIATILNFSHIDKKMFELTCKPFIDLLNSRKKRWNEIAKGKLTLYRFLKKHIYNKSKNENILH